MRRWTSACGGSKLRCDTYVSAVLIAAIPQLASTTARCVNDPQDANLFSIDEDWLKREVPSLVFAQSTCKSCDPDADVIDQV